MRLEIAKQVTRLQCKWIPLDSKLTCHWASGRQEKAPRWGAMTGLSYNHKGIVETASISGCPVGAVTWRCDAENERPPALAVFLSTYGSFVC